VTQFGHRVPAEQMTVRARLYLLVASLRHLAFGIPLLVRPQDFDTPSFNIFAQIMPRWAWATMMITAGLYLAFAMLRATEVHARLALVASAVAAVMWCTGLVTAIDPDRATTWILPTVFAAIAFKDFVMCAQPLRLPFEPIIRRFVRDDEVAGAADVSSQNPDRASSR
jgi:hypothetical protein